MERFTSSPDRPDYGWPDYNSCV